MTISAERLVIIAIRRSRSEGCEFDFHDPTEQFLYIFDNRIIKVNSVLRDVK